MLTFEILLLMIINGFDIFFDLLLLL